MVHPGTWRAAEWDAVERDEAWRTLVGRTHLGWQLDGTVDDGPSAEPALSAHRVGDHLLVDCTAGPCSGRRGRREVADAEDHLALLVVLAGSEQVEQAGVTTLLQPGTALLWDGTRPARFAVHAPLRKRTLLVRRARLAPLLPPGAAIAPGPLRPGPATRLLVDYLAALSTAAGALAGPAAAAADQATLALLAAALAPAVPVGDDVLWERVRSHVEQHLGDPALRPATIAAAHALSLRGLYLLFERRGETVGGYVRRRRLARALADLERLRTATTVAAVAQRSGFTDQTGFTRAFRRQYGCTPDDVRRDRAVPGRPGPGSARPAVGSG